MLKATTTALSETYRLALLDLDGVVYYGKQPVPHASASITEAQRLGMTIEYTTNNSSRMQGVVAGQLHGFGLDVQPWQVITSSVVAARMVARHVPAGARVLVVGADHLRDEVAKQGLVIVDNAKDDPAAVIQGWYPQMTWQQMAEAAYAVEAGAQFFVTNRDLTIPREQGIAPGCGSMIQAVVNATGVEPLASAGKPESAMYDEARMLAAHDGETMVSVAQSLAIGDRLDTDIEAGNRGGYDSLLVLTGVTDERLLMCAPAALRPTYIARDLRGLNVPHPGVERLADGDWRCGGMTATWRDGAVAVSDTTSIDALRAACALIWDRMDNGADAAGIALPQFHLDD
ncbi:HAD-IIA family hydrolase [Bifidobacterium pseudolongum]|uniref:HAD-IIA family hydrolase n=1 Tax=Bifidobacterium pseudolongum TaxID=1694 RepID=UPI003511F3CA